MRMMVSLADTNIQKRRRTNINTGRIRRCNLPRRLPRRRPHRRRRHARHHGASTTPRRPLNRHLRLVPFRDGAGPALRLLDAGGAQGTESGQGGGAGSVQRDQLVQQPRSVRGGRDGDWVFQESGDWEFGSGTYGHDQDVAGGCGDVFGVQGYADIVSL